MALKINIVGAGIIGLGSAYCLSQKFPDCDITVMSSKYHPNTTSDHGFGIVILRSVDIMDNSDALDHVMATIEYCRNMRSEEAEDAGIRLVETVILYNVNNESDQRNEKFVFKSGINVKPASPQELGFAADEKIKRLFHDVVTDETLRTNKGFYYVIDTSVYLPWLQRKLQNLKHRDGTNRVRFITNHVTKLTDVGKCDLIVNCSGLGARELVNDSFIVPIRGQYLSMEIPDLRKMIIANHTYIVPRINDVAVGNVFQIGRDDTTLDPEDSEDILRRCEVIFPAVRSARTRRVDVGIRPGRIGGPRIELERLDIDGSRVPVIHNYGHGPRGIAQHWGCAQKVVELASQIVTPNAKL